ncbi:uncharacterized protein [Drosophila pseudoobscura]|uniref:Uncharacterized protein isoform X1 n=1 Tax=Drosophila pseudoobscura pseudoobscura TaxID=46245 RepID=A0A6I8UTA6_DROPS|nr:uncharacterized protein LOC4803946 isoform X1 [Drosophila pseudoobscura]
MFSRQQLMLICLGLGVLGCLSLPIEKPADIEEDVISIDNQPQKVIRVHPQDLPSKKDHTGANMNSALFQIQTLRPVTSTGNRKYVDSKQMRMRMRKRRPRPATDGEDSSQPIQALKQKELKAFPKQKTKQQKQLKFIPPQTDAEEYLNGDMDMDTLKDMASQLLPVQMTPGPYPVYYVVSKTNGRFGKFPIKAFGSPAEFSKYLVKSKAEPISRHQRFEGYVRR